MRPSPITPKPARTPGRRSAFSLVELSIVLVILGLLVGGILAGQSLIRAAELRALVSEIDRYRTASFAFRDKYLSLAGDLRNATAFWGHASAVTGCTNRTGTATTSPGTCDGDGTGWLSEGAASETTERFQFWRQMALAGLIEGSYSGVAGAAGHFAVTLGGSVPKSRIGEAGWWATYYPLTASEGYANPHGNTLVVGSVLGGGIGGGFLKPEELWNIDTKIDDGKPARGSVRARRLATCTSSALDTDFDATYLLTSTALGCAMMLADAY